MVLACAQWAEEVDHFSAPNKVELRQCCDALRTKGWLEAKRTDAVDAPNNGIFYAMTVL